MSEIHSIDAEDDQFAYRYDTQMCIRDSAYGDRYLVQFSTLLREFWKDLGIVGRMGGDEFIVILRRARREKVEQKIQEFERALARENEKNTELKMDTAYGTAYGEEYPGETIREVYRHADERMYEMKRRMKKGRK